MKKKLILAGFVALAGIHTANAQNASEYNNNATINGNNCSAFGFNALNNNLNTSGNNTALGWDALLGNKTGTENTASGNEALSNNVSGSGNTATGYQSLFSSIGYYNAAFGNSALYNNLVDGNSAFGHNALYSNNYGQGNTAHGFKSLFKNTSGNSNTATGSSALYNNTTGTDNTAMGINAAYSSATAHYIAAFGSGALYSNGVDINTAFGFNALYNSNTGNSNTGIGYKALYTNTSGSNNTALGTGADVGAANLNNASALGSGAVSSASNKIRVGNSTITVIEGQVAFTNPSDGRFKSNINEDDVKGLAFITKLRPVVYNFDTRKFTEFLTKNMPADKQKEYLKDDFAPSSAIRQSGFIAQEVEQAAKEAGYDFNGLHKPDNDHDNYSIAYSQFVVPLVKAVQEQQKMIEALQKQLADNSTSAGNSQAAALTTGLNPLTTINGFSMEQNVPNPFTHETVIKYNLPQQVNNAYMAVYDLSGKQLTTFPITQKGAAALTVTSDKLAAGIYIYSIVADGSILDSKRMVVTDK